MKTRRGKTVCTKEKGRRTGEGDRSDKENGSKRNYLRKQKRKRNITWNQEKRSMRPNNRRRLREVANWCMIRKWRIALISEIIADNAGVIHLREGKRRTVIDRGKKQQLCKLENRQ